VQLRVILASLIDGGALSSCSCPTHCCHGTWLRLAPGDPWEPVLRSSGMSGLATPAPRRMDARARTVGEHFVGTACAFRSDRMGLGRVQANIPPLSPPEAQTHVHSEDKHPTQWALTQVASDRRAHDRSDLAEASELIMKRLPRTAPASSESLAKSRASRKKCTADDS